MTIPNYHPSKFPPMPINEHPQHWLLNVDGDEMKILLKASHGDLIINPENDYRTEGVYFVCRYYDSEGNLQVTKDRADISNAAYYSVPLTVTRHIPDPIAFYIGYMSNKKARILERDYHGIELDAEIHQTCLQRLTKGKPIHFQRKVYYDNSGYFGKSGVYLKPDENLDENESSWILLKPSTPARHLEAPSQIPVRNPIVIKKATAYKKKYETAFLTFLKTAPAGTSLSLQSPLPKEPNADRGGMGISSVSFNRLEGDILYADENNWDEKPTTLAFSLKTVTQYGRFGGIPLWVCSERGAFLPLPYQLES